MSKSCIFCSIISGQEPCVQIHRDNGFLVLMDKYPINPGHALVMPTKHYETLLHMPPAQVGKLYSLVRRFARPILSPVKVDALNFGQNKEIVVNKMFQNEMVKFFPGFNV